LDLHYAVDSGLVAAGNALAAIRRERMEVVQIGRYTAKCPVFGCRVLRAESRISLALPALLKATSPSLMFPVRAPARAKASSPGPSTKQTSLRDGGWTLTAYITASCGPRMAGSPSLMSGAGTGVGQGTEPGDINDAGAISGLYVDNNNVTHSFLRTAGREGDHDR
jgi:hypothetical protein